MDWSPARNTTIANGIRAQASTSVTSAIARSPLASHAMGLSTSPSCNSSMLISPNSLPWRIHRQMSATTAIGIAHANISAVE